MESLLTQPELSLVRKIYTRQIDGLDVDKVSTLSGSFKTLSTDFAYSLVFPDHFKHLFPRDKELHNALIEMVAGQTLIELGAFRRPLECLWQNHPKEVYLVDPNLNYVSTKNVDFPLNLEKKDAISFFKEGHTGNTLSVGMMGDDILSREYASKLAKAIFDSTPKEGYAFHLINDAHILDSFHNSGFKIQAVYDCGLRKIERNDSTGWDYYLFRK